MWSLVQHRDECMVIVFLLFYKCLEGLVTQGTVPGSRKQTVSAGSLQPSNRGDKVNGKRTDHYNARWRVRGAAGGWR